MFHQIKVKATVLSVGNLSMGGSGKTPFVHYLIGLSENKNIKTAVIYKSYKATVIKPSLVELKTPHACGYYGDEACLTKFKFKTIDVYSGASKSDLVYWASKQCEYDLFIVDDGFQHLRLKRDVDIVLVDATLDVKDAQVFPLGYLRESLAALNRAQLILLTKVNWADEENLNIWRKKLEKFNFFEVEYNNTKAIEFSRFRFNYLHQVNTYNSESLNLSEYKDKKFALLSGLATNEVFSRSLKMQNVQIVKEFFFPDHFNFQKSDIDAVVEYIKNNKVDGLIMSEKDAVKLVDYDFLDLFVLIPQVEISKNDLLDLTITKLIGEHVL